MTTPLMPPHFRPYGSTPEYLRELALLAAGQGYVVTDRLGTSCLRRLANPRHKCSHNPDPADRFGIDGPGDHTHALDHPIWLRHIHSGVQWALLVQPYDRSRPIEALEFLAVVVGGCVEYLDAAPYGHGTQGILIHGSSLSYQGWGKRRGKP